MVAATAVVVRRIFVLPFALCTGGGRCGPAVPHTAYRSKRVESWGWDRVGPSCCVAR